MLKDFFNGARVGVTGAGGTVGSELLRQLLTLPVGEVRALEINEEALAFLSDFYRSEPRFDLFLCDVRDFHNTERLFEGLDYVFHTAAFKHVDLCERSPFTAVATNIMGVESVIRAAISRRVRKVLFTSSDKAVNPSNVMGTSKLMGERMITAANALTQGKDRTVFASTRFGNVAGSSGSVIPLFAKQIAAGGPLTLTDRQMTRFIMTLSEATRLVMSSLVIAEGGEVFVTKMPTIKIEDLARIMIEMLAPAYGHQPGDIAIKEIGPRPGEKMFEELLNEEEVRRTLEMDQLFAVLPAIRNIYADVQYTYNGVQTKPAKVIYNSSGQEPLDDQAVARFLEQPSVLPEAVRLRLGLSSQS